MPLPHDHGTLNALAIDPEFGLYRQNEIVAGLEQIGTWDEIHNFLSKLEAKKYSIG